MTENEVHTSRTQRADLELANRGGVLLREATPSEDQQTPAQQAPARDARRGAEAQ
ncbi:MAG: hypothetical protein RLZZ450_3111 [Pseudomonadota bacterium]|jgi:hypothetical protein